MHQGILAFEAPMVCALVCFAAAQLYVYAWWLGCRPWPILIGALGWLLWSIYFGLLAVSAGPSPQFLRADALSNIRLTELAGGVVIAVWLLLWSRRELAHLPANGRRKLTITWPAWLRA